MANSLLHGTGVALITPFDNNGAVDYNALERLVEHVIARGVNFLVALGTTSEAATLSDEEQAQVLRCIARVNNKRKPLVCGISGFNTQKMTENLKAMDLTGVDALMVSAPYYVRPSQSGIYEHFMEISRASQLPILLYNVPKRTGCNILPSTACVLANHSRKIIGIKEASGDIDQCIELIATKPKNFLVFSGDDPHTLAHLAIGMDGLISVAGNVFIEEVSTIVNHCLNNRYTEARELFYKLLPILELMFAEGNPSGIKFIAAWQGFGGNKLRLPLDEISVKLEDKIAPWMIAHKNMGVVRN